MYSSLTPALELMPFSSQNNGYKDPLATDISEEMIRIVFRLKAKRKNRKKYIKTEALSFEEISAIGENNFDAVVSNFGGLNCINDFNKLSGDLSANLKPNGLFIAVIMDKICPWEILYYIITLKFTEAFRRFNKNRIMAHLNGEKVLTYYFRPLNLQSSFSENFEEVKLFSLGLKTPPPYLVGIYNKIRTITKVWMKMDGFSHGFTVI